MDNEMTVKEIEEQKKEEIIAETNTVQAKGYVSLKIPYSGKFPITLGFLILLIISLLVYQQVTKPKTHFIRAQAQILMRRSENLNEIKRSLTGKAIDVSTGKILKAARIFSSRDDRTVYLELDLQNIKKGLVIDYIRYKEGRFVDHGEIILTNDNIQTVLFNWTINSSIVKLTEGNWKVATYTNGVLANRILYSVTPTGQIGESTQQEVSVNDLDYHLLPSLLAVKRQY